MTAAPLSTRVELVDGAPAAENAAPMRRRVSWDVPMPSAFGFGDALPYKKMNRVFAKKAGAHSRA